MVGNLDAFDISLDAFDISLDAFDIALDAFDIALDAFDVAQPRHDGCQAIVSAVPVPDLQIVCVDCGGDCFPLGWHPEDGEVDEGTVIPYRCRDCMDRWDIVIGFRDDDGDLHD